MNRMCQPQIKINFRDISSSVMVQYSIEQMGGYWVYIYIIDWLCGWQSYESVNFVSISDNGIQ